MRKGPRLFRILGLIAVALAVMTAAAGQASAQCEVNSASGVAGTTFTFSDASGGLSSTTSVTFGNVLGTNLNVTDTSVSVTVPAKSAPTVSSITNTGGLGYLLSGGVGIGSNYGGTGGGNSVQITGTGFSASVDVVIAGGACAGTYSGDFTYSGFSITQVTIGGTAATGVGVASDSVINATAPAGVAGIADVIVVTSYSTNSGSSGVKLYTYVQGGPSISAINPNYGLTVGGNQITITGSGFLSGTYSNGTPATQVTFYCGSTPNLATAVAVTSTVNLSVTVPACSTPGVYQVAVTTVGGTATTSYQYIAPTTPIVAAITPNGFSIANGGTINGGTQVVITGSNFTGATAVAFGPNLASAKPVNSFQINSPGSITTTTPAYPAGTATVLVFVTVANTYTNTTGATFGYVTPAPTVTSISPVAGSTSGGTPVTISGQYFTGATAVTIGGTAVTGFKVVSDTQISATTAAHAAGTGLSVQVTTPNGTGTGTSLYTYGTPPPTVSSVNPAGGSIGGGTPVTIMGSGFFCGGVSSCVTGVAFGGVPATNVSVSSDGTLTAMTPAHSAGTVSISVTTSAGTGTGAIYTYGASAPTVTSISPTSGITQGGTLVTITGTNFSGTPQVTINGVAAGQVTFVNSTTITAVTPAGTGSNVPVIVTTSFGASPPANIYSYTTGPPPTPSPPTVTSINPTSGTSAGGTPVTITGTNLTGATSVMFGGVPATNVVVNATGTSITVATPPGTGTVNVTVQTPGGTSAQIVPYTYVTVAPTVTSITPNSGTTAGGTSVTITGTNFAAGATVRIGGTLATGVTVISPTTITATTPAGSAGPASVAVTVGALTGTGTNLYTYVAQPVPTVTAISPNVGPTSGGTAVTITGTNFTGATAVTIGGTAATLVHVVSATSITAVTPTGTAGAANVVVTTPAGSGTGVGLFTYNAAPTVTGVSPANGVPAGGYTVTISGTNFVTGATVKFGNAPATVINVSGPNMMTVTAPSGTGTVDVTVTTPGGTSVINPSDQFTYAAVPTVTSITPNAGPPSGGTVVTITGTGFTGATAVMFGTNSATTFSVISSTTITATAPPGTGTANVTVTTPGGTTAPNPAGQFSYGKAATSLTLTSSPNPSVYGQTVIFTATVTGHAPTGTVTFSQGSIHIGSAPLTNITATSATATFAISTLPLGADPVTASYGGDANNAADPETITQYVNAPSDSAKLRELQLAAMPVAANLSSQAITGGVDSAIAAGFSGSCPDIPTPNGSGFTYCFDGNPQAQNGATPASQQARARVDDDFAALGYADGASAGSPSAVTPNTAIASNLGAYPPRSTSAPYAPPREWLAWIDLRGTDFDRYSVGSDLVGVQVNALVGLTHRLSPAFVVGVLGGYEHFDFTSQAYNGVLTGQGATVGAYVGWRVTPSVRFTAGGAWSDIFVGETSGTATGDFTGHRWLAFSGLTGSASWAGAVFEPSAEVYTLWEHENAYTDSLGTQQASHDFDTGRASSGLKIAYPFAAGSGTLSPYVGLYGDYYFSMDNATTVGLTTVPIMQGWGARATGGLTVSMPGGSRVGAGGEFSGIGNDTHIWTLTVRGSVPF